MMEIHENTDDMLRAYPKPARSIAEVMHATFAEIADTAAQPKQRRKRQPTADVMREQLALAASEIISLRTSIDTTKTLMRWHDWQNTPKRSWWRRLFDNPFAASPHSRRSK